MEIKIKEIPEEEGKHEFETSLFEGDGITHSRIYYDSIEDFISKYNDKSKGIEGCVIGVPEHFWKTGSEAKKGYFIFIQYEFKEKIRFIVVKNRTVYITNRGKTVDIVV